MLVPKVSVVMSVFNGEKYLRESIESILNQTFKDFEFIIVNDGSLDKTGEILKEYKQKDQRLKVINNELNTGLTKSLNRALALAQGEYIARQDADDISLPQRLEKQIEFFKKNPAIKILGTFAFFIDQNGAVLAKGAKPTSPLKIIKNLIKENPFFHSSVMLEKKILDGVKGYNENFQTSQDYELWFRLLKYYQGENLSSFLIKKRYWPGTIFNKKQKEQLRNIIQLKREALKKGDYPKFSYVYLARNYLSLACPLFLKRFLQKHILKSRKVLSKV